MLKLGDGILLNNIPLGKIRSHFTLQYQFIGATLKIGTLNKQRWTCAIAPQVIARSRCNLNGVTYAELPRQLPSGHHHKYDAVAILQSHVKLTASYPYLSIEQHLDYWI